MIFAALLVALLVASHTGRTQKAAVDASGLVAWLPADGHANDLQGTNHGTLQGARLMAPVR